MSKWFDHAGDQAQFLRLGFLLVGSCFTVALLIGFLLVKRNQVGAVGFLGVALLGILVGAVFTAFAWAGAGASSRAFVDTVTAAGGIRAAQGYSQQESLVARGKYVEAEVAYQVHLAGAPGAMNARLALAALVRDHMKDAVRAERLFLEARELRPTPAQEAAIANALIDLYRATGQRGREMAELARFADRFKDTDGGRRAREALRRFKAEPG